jgi:aminomethyltransferase
MGQIEIAGRNALALVQKLACNDAGTLAVGRAQYSALLSEGGTFIDDILVYRLAPGHFLLVVNAANTARDYAWIAGHATTMGEAAVVDSSSRYALLSLQGPLALDVLQPVCTADLSDIRYYGFAYGEVAGARALVSRTGYTGEDGFEIFVPPSTAPRVWQALTTAGQSAGLIPCGLGARDTLRLEASMRLYGNDIDESNTPLEAGLEWIVGWEKPDFAGREALLRQKQDGVARRLCGLELVQPGIARQGHRVLSAGEGHAIGVVTSGTQTPFLKKAIALAYVPPDTATAGTEVAIDIRGRITAARIVPLPFYKKARK